MSKKDNKKKKQKVVYIDDGSSLADMSGVGGGKKKTPNTPRPRATMKEQWQTYTDAVKMMFLPMLAVLGMLALAFWIVYILL